MFSTRSIELECLSVDGLASFYVFKEHRALLFFPCVVYGLIFYGYMNENLLYD